MTSQLLKNNPSTVSPIAPAVAMGQIEAYSPADEVYTYKPKPSGRFEVRNASVNRDHRLSVISAPSTIITATSWSLRGIATNLPVDYDALGVYWFLTCIENTSPSPSFIAPGQTVSLGVQKVGRGLGHVKAKYPWSRLSPRYEYLMYVDNVYPQSKVKQESAVGTAPPPPIITSQLRNLQSKIAMAWVYREGVSPMSPWLEVDAVPGGGQTVERSLLHTNPAPPGAIGYYIYIQFAGDTIWRRCAHLGEMYMVDNHMPTITRTMVETFESVTPVPTHIKLDPLNTYLLNTNDDILISDGQVENITQPIIDGWDASRVKYGRKVGGGRLVIKPSPEYGDHHYPALLIHNQRSIWERLKVDAEASSLKVGVAFADYNGQQAFGNVLNDCEFILAETGDYGPCTALRIMEECAGGGHSASELKINRCKFAATNPLWIEHKQTCNLMFHDCEMQANIRGEHASTAYCMAWISTPNRVTFTGATHGDIPPGVVFNIDQGDVYVEHLFIDKGFVSFFDYSGYLPARLSVGYLAANVKTWPSIVNYDQAPNMVRQPSGMVAVLDIGDRKITEADVRITAIGEFESIGTLNHKDTSSSVRY